MEQPLPSDLQKILKWLVTDTKWYGIFVDVIECEGDSVVLELNTPELKETALGPWMHITIESCRDLDELSVMVGYPVRMANEDEKESICSQFQLDVYEYPTSQDT